MLVKKPRKYISGGNLFLLFFTGMWLHNGTNLFYSQALLLTVFCRMRFDNYPLDNQVSKLLSQDTSISSFVFEKINHFPMINYINLTVGMQV